MKLLKCNILLLVLSILCLISCSKDLGNYDYLDINEAEIGLNADYEALFGEPFKITPDVHFTKDDGSETDRYEYKWYAYDKSGLAMDVDTTALATTKDLNLSNLPLPPGSYQGVYKIKDTETGVTWLRNFNIQVESTISKGWMVLNDIDGTSRLDMISHYDGEDHNIHDVLAFTNSSLTLEGKPGFVLCWQFEPQTYGIYVSTSGNGTTRIDPESFDWEPTLQVAFEMLGDEPTDLEADIIQPLGANSDASYMVVDGNVYYYLRVLQMRYGVPINDPGTKISPFIGYSGSSFGIDPDILYDETNKRFLRHSFGTSELSSMPEGTLFDYNTGKDLLFMKGTPYNGNEIFAFLKDPNTQEVFLARMAPSGAQLFYDQIPDPIAAEINQADQFAISPDFGYIFYNVGGKVYEYDFSLRTSKLMIDKPGEITLLKFDRNSPIPNQLLVGSYNTSDGGTLEMYSIPPVNGDLVLEDSFDGFGKIVSISYRQ